MARRVLNDSRPHGFSAVLIAVYGIFAISATARAGVQSIRDFSAAPVAYSLSVLAALTYIAVTIALVRVGPRSLLTRGLVILELAGVLGVGLASLLAPSLFPDASVWSSFGRGYGFIPLVLPVAALVYIVRESRRA